MVAFAFFGAALAAIGLGASRRPVAFYVLAVAATLGSAVVLALTRAPPGRVALVAIVIGTGAQIGFVIGLFGRAVLERPARHRGKGRLHGRAPYDSRLGHG